MNGGSPGEYRAQPVPVLLQAPAGDLPTSESVPFIIEQDGEVGKRQAEWCCDCVNQQLAEGVVASRFEKPRHPPLCGPLGTVLVARGAVALKASCSSLQDCHVAGATM